MRWWLTFIFIVGAVSATDLESSYTEGNNFGKEVLTQNEDLTSKIKLEDLPGYNKKTPSIASNDLNKGDLSSDVRQAMESNEVSEYVVDSFNKRSKFIIDPNNDPLFKSSNTDPGLSIQNEIEGYTEGKVEKTCEQGGDDIVHECLENRYVVPQVPLKTVTLTVDHLKFTPTYVQETYVVKHSNFWRHTQYGTRRKHTGYFIRLPKEINSFKAVFCNGFTAQDSRSKQIFNVDCKYIEKFTINNPNVTDSEGYLTIATPSNSLNITLQHRTYEGEAIDRWVGCDSLEQMVDEGLCEYGERILTQGSGIRNINGYAIFKDAWQYKQIYDCKMFKDECTPLRAQGCHQVGSRCKERRQNKCWIYEQTYSCPNGKVSKRQFNDPGLTAFCLTGNCHDQSYTANGSMLNVIARLSLLKEVQEDLRTNKYDPKIFKGESAICRRNCLNFKDCCGRMKGWGVSLKFTDCNPEEKKLAKMREQSLCHQIGTYCSKKILGKCVSKKTSFCCFGTKFARIIQEQGRSQLGINWGDPECPNCRAISIEELVKIDLAKMNFSEVFSDLMNKYQQPNIKILQEKVSNAVVNHMKNLKDDFNNKPKAGSGMVYEDRKDGL